jgi:hypothetical protein
MAGDVMFGRDGGEQRVLGVQSREAMSEVYCLTLDDHANFAVGEDGLLVHNLCFKDQIRIITARTVPAALSSLLHRVHGHHIVMKADFVGTVLEEPVKKAKLILKTFGISILKDKSQLDAAVQAAVPTGKPPVLHNLCYAYYDGWKGTSQDAIHSEAYAWAVYNRLAAAVKSIEDIGGTRAEKKAAVENELLAMAKQLEDAESFW